MRNILGHVPIKRKNILPKNSNKSGCGQTMKVLKNMPIYSWGIMNGNSCQSYNCIRRGDGRLALVFKK
jgi:prepilin signal peptidase PulO-like enzyme (type II secretory pathway)